MKYPSILKLENGLKVLATSAGCGFSLTDYNDDHEATHANKYYSDFHGFESAKNITREYLENTWGIVESKEHAEYIVELARSAGLITSDTWNNINDYFSVNYNGLLFWSGKSNAESRGFKKITIPLPPKEKEWPQVGDNVLFKFDANNISGNLLALTKEYAIISQGSAEQHLHLDSWRLVKPKSKQDLLIEELHKKLLANNCSDEYLLACDIVQGKIEGLSYE